jgi:hypothetical protein
MLEFLLAALAAVRVFLRSRQDTALEILALRQQLGFVCGPKESVGLVRVCPNSVSRASETKSEIVLRGWRYRKARLRACLRTLPVSWPRGPSRAKILQKSWNETRAGGSCKSLKTWWPGTELHSITTS